MASHPLNLAFRFILELIMLYSIGHWGWMQPISHNELLGLILPIVAVSIWGTFAVKNDPSRSGKASVSIPGVARLLLELFCFGSAVASLLNLGYTTLAIILASLVAIHYAISYDRLRWLLKQ